MSSSGQICNYPKSQVIHSHNQNKVQEVNILKTPEELFEIIIGNSTGFGISIDSIKESIPNCKVYETYAYSDDRKTTHKIFFISQLASSDVGMSLENNITFAILTDRSGFNPEFIPSGNLDNTNTKGMLGGSPFRVLQSNISGLVRRITLKNTFILQEAVPPLLSSPFGVSLGITPLESEQMRNKILFLSNILDTSIITRETKENAKLKLIQNINRIKQNTQTIVRNGKIQVKFLGGSITVYSDEDDYWSSLLNRCDNRDFPKIDEYDGFRVRNHLGKNADIHEHEISPNAHFVSASAEISEDFLDKTRKLYRFQVPFFLNIQQYKQRHREEPEIIGLAEEYDEPAEQKLVVPVDNIFSMLNISERTITVNADFQPLHIRHSAFPTEESLRKHEPENKGQLHTVSTAVDEQKELSSASEDLRNAGAFVELINRNAITDQELIQICHAIQIYAAHVKGLILTNISRF